MPVAIPLRRDFDAPTLRRLARRCRDNRQIRRLLALTAVCDGLNRTEAARIGGMDRQTLRDHCPAGWGRSFSIGQLSISPGANTKSMMNLDVWRMQTPRRRAGNYRRGRV